MISPEKLGQQSISLGGREGRRVGGGGDWLVIPRYDNVEVVNSPVADTGKVQALSPR